MLLSLATLTLAQFALPLPFPVVSPTYAETHLYCYYEGIEDSTIDLTSICGAAAGAAVPAPTATILSGPSVGTTGLTCSDFNTQAEARPHITANPDLDRDDDGIPCESLPVR
ncbi:MAG: excalibur calcium-binding domain-containing protein [Leptolyngbyaceae cyanobacterium]